MMYVDLSIYSNITYSDTAIKFYDVIEAWYIYSQRIDFHCNWYDFLLYKIIFFSKFDFWIILFYFVLLKKKKEKNRFLYKFFKTICSIILM